jgi:uncharacterized protein YajQ (UPF0234 family)
MDISNIDDLLMGGNSAQQPMSPEEKSSEEPEVEQEQELDPYEPEHGDESREEPEQDEYNEEEETKESAPEVDEYGNEKERMSKGLKDRLDRKEKQHQREIEQREREIDALRQQMAQQGANREIQQAAKDFEYDPDAGGDWQQQLASFVKQTVNSMTREQEEKTTRQQEAKVQAEFESKFRDGMSRFDDFTDVIQSLPCEISNPMTLATRSMENPAAFLYAAAKRNPQELERISKIRDPYGQMMEMGKLEERMRKNKPATKAPRPLGRAPDDAMTKAADKKKDTSGDDLLAKADAKRLNTVKTRLKGNR